jgi:serine/threonine-protein kinase
MEGKHVVMLPQERAPSMIVGMGSSAGSLVPMGGRSFGDYELLARLATGGMAEIFLARTRQPSRHGSVLVIKRVLPHLAEDARFVSMFRDEARLAARIVHDNVCRVLDVGSVGDTYYIALEYLHGVPLSRVLVRAARHGQPLDFRLVAGLMVQGCAGLHHAHELRGPDGQRLDVVHRDISPPNIFVTADGLVKMLDFGVAKAHGASEKTRTGTVKGKNAYMSPEQVRGQKVDRRSDIFSLGIVLWEALTAKRLFMRDVDFETFRAITEGDVPDVRMVRPETPAELADVVARALALDPADRYATALELGDAVAAAVAGIGSPAGEREVAAFVRKRFESELRARDQLLDATSANHGDRSDEEVTRTGVTGPGEDNVVGKPTPEPGAIEWAPSRKSSPIARITTGSIPRIDGTPAGRINVGPPPGSEGARRGPLGAGRNLPLAAPPRSPSPAAAGAPRSPTTQMSIAAGPPSATPWGTELDLGPASDSGLKLAEPWAPDSGARPGPSAATPPTSAFAPPAAAGPARHAPRGATGSGAILELDLPAPRARTGVFQAVSAPPMKTTRVRALPAPERAPSRAGTAPVAQPRSGGEAAAVVFIAGLLGLLVLLWWLI